MDLFDMTASSLSDLSSRRAVLDASHPAPESSPPSFNSSIYSTPSPPSNGSVAPLKTSHAPYLDDLAEGMANLKNIPTLVLGVQSDILFPVEQQRDLAEALRRAGNGRVSYYELGGVWG